MLKNLTLIALAAGLALTTVFPVQALDVGDKAPTFSATTLDGEAVNIAELLGHNPIYLKFWATWCRYCVNELPHAQHVYDDYGDRIHMLTINVGINDSKKNIKELYEAEGITLPTVFDEDGAITSQYKVIGTPEHVLIGRDGTIKFRSFSATDELDQALYQTYKNAAGE